MKSLDVPRPASEPTTGDGWEREGVRFKILASHAISVDLSGEGRRPRLWRNGASVWMSTTNFMRFASSVGGTRP